MSAPTLPPTADALPPAETVEAKKARLEIEKAEYEIHKLKREHEKLDAEIAEFKKPWHRKAAYIGAILPFLGVLITSGILYINVAVNLSLSKLDAKKEILKLDIAKFEIQKDSLERVKSIVKDSIDVYRSRAKILSDMLNYSTSSEISGNMSDTIFLRATIYKLRDQLEICKSQKE